MHIQLKNRLWTTVALLCKLIWGLANNNYSLCFLQFLTDSANLRLCYPRLYIYSLTIYNWTIEQVDRDIVLLLKITQVGVITICVVLDHSTVIFQKEKKRGEGTYKKQSLVCKTPIVKVDRNKNVTLNRCP